MVGTTTVAVGAILRISAFSRPHMIVDRVVAGIGDGINTATVSKQRGVSIVATNLCPGSRMTDRDFAAEGTRHTLYNRTDDGMSANVATHSES